MSGSADPKAEPRIVDPRATRRALLLYSECAACGVRASNGHHVLPVGRGATGDDVVENVVGLCGTGTGRCHGAFHGNPYEVSLVAGPRFAGDSFTRRERRDREWVCRRIGRHLLARRPDVVAYVLAKLGDEPGRAFLLRVYYLEVPC